MADTIKDDSKKFTIRFTYSSETYPVPTDMRVFIDAKKYILKQGESCEVTLAAGQYDAVFKCSILGTNMSIDLKKDTGIVIGWNATTGKISAKKTAF